MAKQKESSGSNGTGEGSLLKEAKSQKPIRKFGAILGVKDAQSEEPIRRAQPMQFSPRTLSLSTVMAQTQSSSSSSSSSSRSSSSSSSKSSSSSSSSSSSLSSSSSSSSSLSSSSSSSSSKLGITVTFNPNPIYTGYTNPAASSTLKVTVTAQVNPPSQVSNIALQLGGTGYTRAKLANVVRHPDGTITVDVYGQAASPANLVNSDCLLWAVYTPTSQVIAYAPIWIVVPTAVGRPHPTAAGVVSPVNQVANAGTSPADWDSLGAGQSVLWTYWVQWLQIPVVDQFYQPINSIYDGQGVYEYNSGVWRPINQNLSGGSYSDPVFVWVYKNGTQTNPYIVNTNSQEAQQWPGSPPESFAPAQHAYSPQNVQVEIAGFVLQAVGTDGQTLSSPAIQNRQITTPATNEVDVSWP